MYNVTQFSIIFFCKVKYEYVVATSFDLACDQSRVLSGINTLGSNSQMFYNVIGGAGVPSTSTVFVLCTSTIQVRAGAQLTIIQ